MSEKEWTLADKVSLAFVLVPSSLIGLFVGSCLYGEGFHPAWSLIGGIIMLIFTALMIVILTLNIHPLVFGLFYALPVFITVLLNIDVPWSVFFFFISWAVVSYLASIFRETLNDGQ